MKNGQDPYICEPMLDDFSEDEPNQPVFDKSKRKRRRKHGSHRQTRETRRGDFVLDGVMVDSQKRFVNYDQFVDMHLIRFFDKKQILDNLKHTGIINRRGKLLDQVRSKDIWRREAELQHESGKPTEFNIRKKLREQLQHLANHNLIMQPMPGIQMKLSQTHFDGAFGKSPSTGSQMKMIEGISRLDRSQSPLLSDP